MNRSLAAQISEVAWWNTAKRLCGLTEGQDDYMKRSVKRVSVFFLLLIFIIGISCISYVSDYYHASEDAYEAVSNPSDGINVKEKEDTYIAFIPKEPKAGIIFYPGGKVQYEAYAPLMEKCAENGILSVVLHVPWNLAILDRNAADGYKEMFPDVKKWYIGGHSLGGVVAAMYAKAHEGEYGGLIFLASYPSVDLSKTDIDVLSVYGSEDGVLDFEKYKKNKHFLPDDLTEEVIEGGNHAFFGFYGFQNGDGIAAITPEEQVRETSEMIGEFVSKSA